MKRTSAPLIALLVLAVSSGLWADTLTLRDGSQISGTFAGATTRTISFKDSRGVIHRYSTSRIQSLEFNSYTQNTSGQYNNGQNNNGPYNNGQNNNGQYNNGQNTNDQGNNGGFGSRNNRTSSNNQSRETIPVGTQLVIRTNDDIDSKTASANQTFSAQFDQDVIGPSGRVVIPRGSDAKLVIRSVSGGSLTGSSDLVLDVQSVSVNGRLYQISTADLNESSNTGIGKNKRTAEMIGGGAALGAIIGAVVGHGKGAAIGAAAGGAGGAGAQVLLKGKSVNVPAETILTFTLNQQVSI